MFWTVAAGVPPATIAFAVATSLWGVYSRDVEGPPDGAQRRGYSAASSLGRPEWRLHDAKKVAANCVRQIID